MSCTRPGAITAEELLAYAEGAAPDRVADHLRACPACSAQVEGYRALGGGLRAGLLRFDCPPPQLIGEYELALLGPEERQRVAAHLVDCARCAEELATLRSFMAAPEPVAVPGTTERLRRIVARLVTPQGGQLAPALGGLRGGAESGIETYRAETTTIALEPSAGSRRGRVMLMGMVWQEGAAPDALVGVTVRLVGSGGADHAQIDDLGNFVFDDVAPGSYQLELLLPNGVVVVEDVGVDAQD